MNWSRAESPWLAEMAINDHLRDLRTVWYCMTKNWWYKWGRWKNRETAIAICFTFSTGVLSITGFHNFGKSLSPLWYFFIILIQKNRSLSKYSSTAPLISLHLLRLLSSTWSKMRLAKWGNLLQSVSIFVKIETWLWKLKLKFHESRKIRALQTLLPKNRDKTCRLYSYITHKRNKYCLLSQNLLHLSVNEKKKRQIEYNLLLLTSNVRGLWKHVLRTKSQQSQLFWRFWKPFRGILSHKLHVKWQRTRSRNNKNRLEKKSENQSKMWKRKATALNSSCPHKSARKDSGCQGAVDTMDGRTSISAPFFRILICPSLWFILLY